MRGLLGLEIPETWLYKVIEHGKLLISPGMQWLDRVLMVKGREGGWFTCTDYQLRQAGPGQCIWDGSRRNWSDPYSSKQVGVKVWTNVCQIWRSFGQLWRVKVSREDVAGKCLWALFGGW